MDENDKVDSRKGLFFLAAAIAVLVIPVVVGVILANTGSSDAASSDDGGGMGDGVAASADAPDVVLRPFDEILDGGFTVEVDPAGTSAVLRLDTTIDVVCSVVYGPTTGFGGLSTDDDMAGGGHRNHHPLMTDLEPGTTVLYRVQGVAADGSIYVSDVLQFDTTTTGAAPRTNLALRATVTDVSSEFSSSWAGDNAIDGSLGTEWASLGDGDDAYIVIDLGSDQAVTGVGFRTREMSDGTSITNSFTVTVDDGETFGPFEAGLGLAVGDFETTGRVFRIDVDTSTGGNTGAVEIEIYGS